MRAFKASSYKLTVAVALAMLAGCSSRQFADGSAVAWLSPGRPRIGSQLFFATRQDGDVAELLHPGR